MFSSTRKCWPRSRFGETGRVTGGRTLCSRSRRCGRRARPRLRRVRRRALRRCGRRSRARSAGRGRLGREVGAVGLGEDAVGGDVRGALAQVGRLRIRDVPGKRDVVATLEGGLEERWQGEAVQDHRSLKAPQGRERVLVGRACVRRRPACGARRRARAPARRGGAGRRAARSRGSDRGRSRRRQPPRSCSRRSRSSPSRSASSPAASCG